MPAGLITMPSPVGPEETFERLRSAVVSRGLKVFATIDHKEAARQVGLEMRPTKVLIFGGPMAGTPLMRMVPTLAIDLPLKMLVWEDDQGRTHLSYNAACWIVGRHGFGVGDPQEASWESEGGAVDPGADLRWASRADLGTTVGPLVVGMANTLAEIAKSVCRIE